MGVAKPLPSNSSVHSAIPGLVVALFIGVLVAPMLVNCGSSDVTTCAGDFEITGTWDNGTQTMYVLAQQCNGDVTGTRTVRNDQNVVLGQWNINGSVQGSRFLWTGNCVDDSCTYPTYRADGADGTGFDIVNSTTMDGLVNADPSRANFIETLHRE